MVVPGQRKVLDNNDVHELFTAMRELGYEGWQIHPRELPSQVAKAMSIAWHEATTIYSCSEERRQRWKQLFIQAYKVRQAHGW